MGPRRPGIGHRVRRRRRRERSRQPPRHQQRHRYADPKRGRVPASPPSPRPGAWVVATVPRAQRVLSGTIAGTGASVQRAASRPARIDSARAWAPHSGDIGAGSAEPAERRPRQHRTGRGGSMTDTLPARSPEHGGAIDADVARLCAGLAELRAEVARLQASWAPPQAPGASRRPEGLRRGADRPPPHAAAERPTTGWRLLHRRGVTRWWAPRSPAGAVDGRAVALIKPACGRQGVRDGDPSPTPAV